MWVIFDQGRGLRRAAHFRFAPEADVELEYCHLSRWANRRRRSAIRPIYFTLNSAGRWRPQ
jgi:hypothetical protein